MPILTVLSRLSYKCSWIISSNELKKIVTSELKVLLAVGGQQRFVKHIRWKNAFRLFCQEYNMVLEAIDKIEKVSLASSMQVTMRWISYRRSNHVRLESS